MQEEQTGLKAFGQIRHVVMELPKYTTGKHPKNHIEKWAYFFLETERLNKIPKELSDEVYEEAFEIARIANMSEEEYDAYERSKMAEQDKRGSLTLAKRQGFQKGVEAGRQEGRQAILKKQLQLRFQHIPASIHEQIEQASIEQLDIWSEQILSAKSLHAMFGKFKE